MSVVFDSLNQAKVKFWPFVDAALFNGDHPIDDRAGLRKLLGNPTGVGRIDMFRFSWVPGGTEADDEIIEHARLELEENARPVYILSNDKFRDHPRASGIPRIAFSINRAGSPVFDPPLHELLHRRTYLARYPEHILSDGVPCKHLNVFVTVTVDMDGHRKETPITCSLCGEAVENWQPPSDDLSPE